MKKKLAEEAALSQRPQKDTSQEEMERKMKELKEKNRQLILEKTELQRVGLPIIEIDVTGQNRRQGTLSQQHSPNKALSHGSETPPPDPQSSSKASSPRVNHKNLFPFLRTGKSHLSEQLDDQSRISDLNHFFERKSRPREPGADRARLVAAAARCPLSQTSSDSVPRSRKRMRLGSISSNLRLGPTKSEPSKKNKKSHRQIKATVVVCALLALGVTVFVHNFGLNSMFSQTEQLGDKIWAFVRGKIHLRSTDESMIEFRFLG